MDPSTQNILLSNHILTIAELNQKVDDEWELDQLDRLFDEWLEKATEQNIDVEAYVHDYFNTKVFGDTLRSPQMGRLKRVAFEQQRVVRSIEINRMIKEIALTAINRREMAALEDPRLKHKHPEIKGDARYLRNMLPEDPSMQHPTIIESIYHSIKYEIERLTRKVLNKL